MPIYEFYCRDCHRVLSFLSSTAAPGARPACPRCGRPELERKPSTFAVTRGGGQLAARDGEPGLPGLDEERVSRAMEEAVGELEASGSEDDPRAVARLLRRFGDVAGVEPGPRMEEVLVRLEAGEDPEGLEEVLGDGEGGEDGEADLEELFRARKQGAGRRRGRPLVDDRLYFLPPS